MCVRRRGQTDSTWLGRADPRLYFSCDVRVCDSTVCELRKQNGVATGLGTRSLRLRRLLTRRDSRTNDDYSAPYKL